MAVLTFVFCNLSLDCYFHQIYVLHCYTAEDLLAYPQIIKFILSLLNMLLNKYLDFEFLVDFEALSIQILGSM